MATYPYSFTNPSSGDDLATGDHAGQHSYLNDVIENIESVTGIDGSVDTNSLDYKLNNISTSQIENDSIDWDALAIEVQKLLVPAGTIKDYVGTIAPTGWVFLQGQTIVNGQTLYPSLYANLPGLFIGSDLIVPNAQNAYTLYSSLTNEGDVGNTSLIQSNNEIPDHVHGTSPNTHFHFYLALPHTHNTSHGHNAQGYTGALSNNFNVAIYRATSGATTSLPAANRVTVSASTVTTSYGASTFSSNTISSGGPNTGTSNNVSFTSSSGNTSPSVTALPPSVYVNKMMKVH